jgi:hypothetical protein
MADSGRRVGGIDLQLAGRPTDGTIVAHSGARDCAAERSVEFERLTMFWLKACPRCHGDLHEIHDVGDQYVTCLQCGRILTVEQEKALPRLLNYRRGRRAESRRVDAA